MPVALLFLVVAGAAAVAVLHPRYRIVAITALVLLAGVTSLYFLTLGDEAADADPLIPASAVSLNGVELTEERGYFRLSGRVTNGAAAGTLTRFTVDVVIYDCPEEESPTEECAIIAESEGLARVEVPPGQTRTFSSIHRFSDTPEPLGVRTWDHTVLSASGLR